MQNAEVVLSMLGQKSTQNSEFVFDRLYRNLFNPDFYLLAHSIICAREGNMTRGVDKQTTDGFDTAKVEEIITKLKQERYTPPAVRSVSMPEKHGTICPLGSPFLQDKLVQEVIRLLLQAVYEPIFKDSSHGFRPTRSCHTALAQLKTTSKGTEWVVGGEIKGCFDSFNHVKLLKVLSRKISDGRFLDLIGKFLKAGYMEFRQVHNSLTGTSQGGIVSPILANIYLHELDVFLEQTCHRLTAQKVIRGCPQTSLRLTMEHLPAREDERASDIPAHMGTIPSQEPFGPRPIKITYIRYADAFIVMLNGGKDLAEHVREEIRDFLRQKLQLELCEEEILIIKLADQPVRFLGYEVARTREKSAMAENALGVKQRATHEAIQLLVPGEIIREKLKPFVKNTKAIHHNARINLPLLDLLRQYNAEIQGLYDYYCLATDVHTKIGKFKYYHYHSLLKTVACKEKCSIAQVLSKYGIDVKFKQKTGTRKVFGVTYQTEAGLTTLTYFDASLKSRAIRSQNIRQAGEGRDAT